MEKTITARNVFEYMRLFTVAAAIYNAIGSGEFEPAQIAEWCSELSEKVWVFDGLEPIDTFDRCLLKEAAGGAGKVDCVKLYRDLSGESLKESKSQVEALFGNYF